MSSGIILDASAIIAVLCKEKGSEAVVPYFPHALVSTVNLTEIASYMTRHDYTFKQAREWIESLMLQIVEYDEEQAFLAAKILPKTRIKGLSLGDRACFALALSRKLPVLTSDNAWKHLDVGVKVLTFR